MPWSLLVAAAAFDAPGHISHAWSDFKQQGSPGRGTSRLSSTAGEGRYQFWAAAVREDQTRPLAGTGSGTFEYWWNRDGDTAASIRDTHSLYMQTLGELGIVGLALLAAFLAAILLGGARATLRAGRRGRPQLAAALAGCAAFCLTASFDWMWQIPVLPVAMLLLASVLVSSGARSRRDATPGLRLPPRVARRRDGIRRSRRDRDPARLDDRGPPEPGGRPCRQFGGGACRRHGRPKMSSLTPPPRASSRRCCSSGAASWLAPPQPPKPRPRARRPTGGPGWSSRESKPSAAKPPQAVFALQEGTLAQPRIPHFRPVVGGGV